MTAVIITNCPDGSPAVLVGPFDTFAAAMDYMEVHDEWFCAEEIEAMTEWMEQNPGEVPPCEIDTRVTYLTAPIELVMGPEGTRHEGSGA